MGSGPLSPPAAEHPDDTDDADEAKRWHRVHAKELGQLRAHGRRWGARVWGDDAPPTWTERARIECTTAGVPPARALLQAFSCDHSAPFADVFRVARRSLEHIAGRARALVTMVPWPLIRDSMPRLAIAAWTPQWLDLLDAYMLFRCSRDQLPVMVRDALRVVSPIELALAVRSWDPELAGYVGPAPAFMQVDPIVPYTYEGPLRRQRFSNAKAADATARHEAAELRNEIRRLNTILQHLELAASTGPAPRKPDTSTLWDIREPAPTIADWFARLAQVSKLDMKPEVLASKKTVARFCDAYEQKYGHKCTPATLRRLRKWVAAPSDSTQERLRFEFIRVHHDRELAVARRDHLVSRASRESKAIGALSSPSVVDDREPQSIERATAAARRRLWIPVEEKLRGWDDRRLAELILADVWLVDLVPRTRQKYAHDPRMTRLCGRLRETRRSQLQSKTRRTRKR